MRRLLSIVAAAVLAAVVLAGDGLGRDAAATTEVVVTLDAPPLSTFGRSLLAARHVSYLRRLDAEQAAVTRRIETTVPSARVRWRYRLVANGLAVVLPRSQVAALAGVPGVAKVWPNVRYHSLGVALGPQQIGADKLWGPGFETAGNGMKIGIIDDGIDAAHPYFNPNGFQYPPGFPKGQTRYATPKVIVQRTFPPPSPTWKYAAAPFDPVESFHATHVAGIAAGVHGVVVAGNSLSGVAPNAYIGNYKALTIPTPGFGLDGNSAEIAAAIEAAVADGMDVINLSLGEPEVEPSRDLVVKAIEGAAAAGVVPVVAAGNDFGDFGYGTVSSPANAPDAITVAAVNSRNVVADFSSAGPTPLSLQMKPDVSAPGVDVISSLPPSQGLWGTLSGTSMATPHVAAAAALLEERHPTWTVAQIKSALVQTGDPVRVGGVEAPTTREGGGLVDLPRADNPLLFAAPTGLSFGALPPGAVATRTVSLTDAGGGAGTWNAAVSVQSGSGVVSAPSTVTVPGTVDVTATGSTTAGDETGFVVLSRGTDVRRIPFWFLTSVPKLAGEPTFPLAKPGIHHGTTAGAPSLVTRYRYPTGGDQAYPGPERVFRFHLRAGEANAGVVVLSGRVVPHVTFDGSEDRLAGYTALPLDLNPYRKSYGARRRAAGIVLPARGTYDAVFESVGAPGPFSFRYWVNDVTPPRLQVRSTRGEIVIGAADTGSGIDPVSLTATLDGKPAKARYADGTIRIRAAAGRHRLVLSVSDYQEMKNMEDVARILPNTATLRTTLRVR